MPSLLLVGARQEALAAAARLGCTVYLLSDKALLRQHHRQSRTAAQVNYSATPTVLLAEARRLTQGAKLDAVVATTERAVLPAAQLRRALGLGGNDLSTARLCRDKFEMKSHARAHGIKCADFLRVTARTTPKTLAKQLGIPLVLKPCDSSGARDARVVRLLSELGRLPPKGYVAESFVHGLEMSVESFVKDGKVLFANPTEYLLPLFANVVPADALSKQMRAEVLSFNQRVIDAFGIRQGMTHLELFLTSDGPVFGEIAIRPPGGKLMQLLERAYGFDPWEALLRIELGKPVRLPRRARRYAGIWFVHPGAGRVERIHGTRAATRVPGVVEVNCRAQVGDDLRERLGSGETVGHIVAQGPNRRTVVDALERARRHLVLEVTAARSA